MVDFNPEPQRVGCATKALRMVRAGFAAKSLRIVRAACAVAAASALVLAVPPGAGAQDAPRADATDVQLEALSFRHMENRVEFRELKVSVGDTTIEADAASADEYDFEKSEWHLTGNVRSRVGPVRMEANSATLAFQDGQLQQFELQGEPATFENPEAAEGRGGSGGANRIAYDESEGQLSLTGNAWLSVGSNEIVGCDLVYDIDAVGNEPRFWSGSTECDERFRIRISPAEGNGADDARAP